MLLGFAASMPRSLRPMIARPPSAIYSAALKYGMTPVSMLPPARADAMVVERAACPNCASPACKALVTWLPLAVSFSFTLRPCWAQYPFSTATNAGELKRLFTTMKVTSFICACAWPTSAAIPSAAPKHVRSTGPQDLHLNWNIESPLILWAPAGRQNPDGHRIDPFGISDEDHKRRSSMLLGLHADMFGPKAYCATISATKAVRSRRAPPRSDRSFPVSSILMPIPR